MYFMNDEYVLNESLYLSTIQSCRLRMYEYNILVTFVNVLKYSSSLCEPLLYTQTWTSL